MSASLPIEGASPEQQQLLDEILAALGPTSIEAIRLRPFDPGPPEDEHAPAPGPHGIELHAATESMRGHWEAELTAAAFRARSAALGLPRVVCVSVPDSGTNLEWSDRRLQEPLGEAEKSDLEATVRRAAAVAGVEQLRFQLLHPHGTALAVAVRVAEAHRFLRSKLRPFRGELLPWLARLEGLYVEVLDGDPQPVWVEIASPAGGGCAVRGDVQCCSGPVGFSQGYDWDGPPPCPVFA